MFGEEMAGGPVLMWMPMTNHTRWHVSLNIAISGPSASFKASNALKFQKLLVAFDCSWFYLICQMRDCSYFENRLLAGIPYSERYGIESILRSFQSSQVMLNMLQRAVESIRTPASIASYSLVAFGSFGRLDGDPRLSDFDPILLYVGRDTQARTKALRRHLSKIVKNNQGLPFDHRNEIEKGEFLFDSSPA